jgi:hypothetical protein
MDTETKKVIEMADNEIRIVHSKMDGKEYEYEDVCCKYQFTTDEKERLAEKMSQMWSEMRDLEKEKKAIMADFTALLKRINEDIDNIARKHKQGFEYRDISCSIERDFEKKEIRWIRSDTFETAQTRKMKTADLQQQLPEDTE